MDVVRFDQFGVSSPGRGVNGHKPDNFLKKYLNIVIKFVRCHNHASLDSNGFHFRLSSVMKGEPVFGCDGLRLKGGIHNLHITLEVIIKRLSSAFRNAHILTNYITEFLYFFHQPALRS